MDRHCHNIASDLARAIIRPSTSVSYDVNSTFSRNHLYNIGLGWYVDKLVSNSTDMEEVIQGIYEVINREHHKIQSEYEDSQNSFGQ